MFIFKTTVYKKGVTETKRETVVSTFTLWCYVFADPLFGEAFDGRFEEIRFKTPATVKQTLNKSVHWRLHTKYQLLIKIMLWCVCVCG